MKGGIMKDNRAKIKPAGIYYLGCESVNGIDHGTNVFNFTDGKFRAVFLEKQIPRKTFANCRIAKVKFFENGKIDSKGRHEFLRWM
jgi:hypothetical protein